MFQKKDSIPNVIKEAMQTKGIERSLLEVKLIKAITSSLQWQFWQNLVSVAFGALLSFSLSYYISQKDNDQSMRLLQLKLIDKQTEIESLKNQIFLQKHHSQEIQPKKIYK